MIETSAPPHTSPADEIDATVRQAIQHQKAGQIAEARILYQVILQMLPGHPEANHNLGILLMQGPQNEHAQAVAHLEAAITASPATAQYWLSYIDALIQCGENETARQVVLLARAHGLKSEALDTLAARIQKPDTAAPAEAPQPKAKPTKTPRKSAGKGAKPSDREIKNIADLFNQGRHAEAEAAARDMTNRFPHHGFGWKSLGAALQVQGQHRDEALTCLKKAATLMPNDVQAQCNLGAAYLDHGKREDAITSFERALKINPRHAPAHYNLGNAFQHLGEMEKAAAAYRKALELQPDYVDAYNNLGAALNSLGKHGEAIACHQEAIKLDPNHYQSYLNLGHALQGKGGKVENVLLCFQKALEIKPDFAAAYNNTGLTLQNLGHLNEAETNYRRAVLFDPSYVEAFSNMLFCLSHKEGITPEDLFTDHLRFGEMYEAPLRASWQPHTNSKDPDRPLRVGFVSADFHHHAVAYFVDQLFENLAKIPQISTYAYYNNTIEDKITKRFRCYFSHWQAVSTLSDDALAAQIRADGIDILIDLSGHTGKHRLLTFARKPAPIQIGFIGYPGTSGLSAMDYNIQTKWVEQSGEVDSQFTEKLILLPANLPFQHFSELIELAEPPVIQNGYITFGSFNRASKINDGTIRLWADVLHRDSNAKMLIGAMDKTNSTTIAHKFENCGIGKERLIFEPRTSFAEYMKLHNKVDILLDTYPYCGGTTSIHGMWMGVPVVAYSGKTVPQRTADQVIGAYGLSDWVTHSIDEYVERAIRASKDIESLKVLRATMRKRIKHLPYASADDFAVMFCRILRTVWKRWCLGQPASKLYID